LEIRIKVLLIDLFLKMVREAALLVHPTRAEQRIFVGDNFEEVVEALYEETRPVYAITQNKYDDELVGDNFIQDSFPDRDNKGSLTQEAMDKLSDFEKLYLGGGKASECVLSAARSMGYRGWEPGEIAVGAEITYEPVGNQLLTVEDIIEEGTIDESEYLGSLYYLAEIDSVL
jgi:hypothetical protein